MTTISETPSKPLTTYFSQTAAEQDALAKLTFSHTLYELHQRLNTSALNITNYYEQNPEQAAPDLERLGSDSLYVKESEIALVAGSAIASGLIAGGAVPFIPKLPFSENLTGFESGALVSFSILLAWSGTKFLKMLSNRRISRQEIIGKVQGEISPPEPAL